MALEPEKLFDEQLLEPDQQLKDPTQTTKQTTTPKTSAVDFINNVAERAFASTPGGSSGAFSPKAVSYDAVKNYVDMPQGYIYGMADIEDFYAQQEGPLRTAGKFAARFGLGTVAKMGETVGHLIGFANPLNWDSDLLSNVGDNAMSKMFTSLEDKVKQDWFPVFNEAADRDKGFFQRFFTDGDFWASDVADAGAFLASTFAPGMALAKLALGVRALKGVSALRVGTSAAEQAIANASKVQNYFTQSAKIARLFDKKTAWGAATLGESVFEANENRNNIIESLSLNEDGTVRINEDTGRPYTEKEKKDIAGRNAQNSFILNAALLGVTNTFQLKWLGKIFNDAPEIAAKGIKNPSTLLGSMQALEKSGTLQKFLDGKVGRFFSGAPSGIISEGFIEENIQLGIQRINERYGKQGKVRDVLNIAELFEQTGNQTMRALMGDDPEASISIGLGGAIGAPISGISNIMNAGREKLVSENIITAYNNSQQNWLKFGNIYKTQLVDSVDDKGNPVKVERIVFDKSGMPVEDTNKVAGILSGYRAANLALEESDKLDKGIYKDILRDQAFIEFTKAHIAAGIDGDLLKKLDDVLTATPEDIASLGFVLNDNVQEQVNKYKNLATKVIKQNKLINDSVLFDNTEEDQSRKKALIELASEQALYDNLIQELKSSKTELRNELVDGKNTSLSDSLVEQLNDQLFRINSQREKTETIKKQFGEDSFRYKMSAEVLSDLEKDLENTLKNNETSVKDLKKGEDGFYKYENKKRNRPGILDQYNEKSKIIAGLDNTIDELGYEWAYYADAKNGKKNYLDNFENEVVKPLQEAAKKNEELKKAEELKSKRLTGNYKKKDGTETPIEFAVGDVFKGYNKEDKKTESFEVTDIDTEKNLVIGKDNEGEEMSFSPNELAQFLNDNKWKKQEVKKDETPKSEKGDTEEGNTDSDDNFPNVDNSEVTESEYGKRPKFEEVGFFKTFGRHYKDDGFQVLNTENGSDRFFAFTAKHNIYNRYYFLKVVTAKNDDFKIRDAKVNPDDIKVVLMKRTKLDDGTFQYNYVDVDNNIIPEGEETKDKLIYNSLAYIKNWTVDRVKDSYTVTGFSDKQIQKEIDDHAKFQKDLAARIEKGEDVYLRAVTTSPGVQTIIRGSEMNEKGVRKPMENNLEGVVIAKDPDFDDLRSAKNPEMNIDLRIVTADNVPARGLKVGRAIMQEYELKNDKKIWGDKISRVFTRELTEDEKETVFQSFLRLSDLYIKKYGKRNVWGKAVKSKTKLTKEEDSELELIQRYLKGIISFSKPLASKETSPSNFYISNGLNRGNKNIPFDRVNLTKNKKGILNNLYHNINSTYLGKDESYQTIKFVKNKAVKDKSYDTYREYLIAKREDGEVSPIYTSMPSLDSGIPQITNSYIIWKDVSSDESVDGENVKEGKPKRNIATPALSKNDQAINNFVALKNDKIIIKGVSFSWKETKDGIVFSFKRGVVQRSTDPILKVDVPKRREGLIAMISKEANYTYGGTSKLREKMIKFLEEETKKKEEEAAKKKAAEEAKKKGSKLSTTPISYKAIKVGDVINVVSKENSNLTGTLTVTDIEKPDFIRFDMRLSDGTQENAIGYSEKEFNELFSATKETGTPLTQPRQGSVQFPLDIDAAVDNAVVKDGKMSATLYEQSGADKFRVRFEASTDIKSGNLLKAKTELKRILLKQLEAENPFDNDIPFRLAVESEVTELDDFDEYQDFMKENLPQIPVQRVNHLIYGKAWGAFLRGGIYIYNKAGKGTGYHEAFEAVWASYLTDEEQFELIKEFRQREGSFTNPYNGITKPYAEASRYDVREMLADELLPFIENESFSNKTIGEKTKSILQRLWDFIKKIFGLSKNERKQLDSKINSIFKKISKGGYKNARAIRDVNTLAPAYKTAPGLTQQETLDVVEGLNFNFFTELFKKGNNVDSIIRSLDKNEVNKLLTSTLETSFNKVLQDVSLRSSKIANIVTAQKESLYDIFKANLKRYGIRFFELDAIEEDKIDNPLGIRDSITIDPRKTTSVNVSLLLLSLPDIRYTKEGNPFYAKNDLNQNKLVDSFKVHTLLLNELSNIPYVINEKGEKANVLDQMFEALDNKYKKPDGKYRDGYYWIKSLKVRLKYEDAKGNKIPVKDLEKDDVLLRVAFTKSFSNAKFTPDKLIVEEDGFIYNFNPLININEDRIRDDWFNNLKLRLQRSTAKSKSLFKQDDQGRYVVNKASLDYQMLIDAKDEAMSLEDYRLGLEMLGIKFSASDEELEYYKTTIAENFKQIVNQFQNNKIKLLEDLFGKEVVGARIDTLISIESAFEGEDNVLSYYNSDGEIQYSVGTPSLFSTTINIINKVNNLKELVMTAPWLGYIDKEGNAQLHPYQSTSFLLKPGGALFDKNGNRKRADKFQKLKYYVISGTGVSNIDGKNTAKLEFPEKIAQKIHYLLSDRKSKPVIGFTVINSDKSTEFGISMPNSIFIDVKDVENVLSGEDERVTNMYIDQLKGEMAAAVYQKTDPIYVEHYSNGVLELGHFRDILSDDLKSKFKNTVLSDDSESFGEYEQFIEDNKKQISKDIQTYLKNKIEQTRDFLLENDIFYNPMLNLRESKYTDAIDNELLNTVLLKEPTYTNKKFSYTNAEVLKIAGIIAINEEISVTEQHKIVYGHPAFYKELPKRANGATSTKEAMIEDSDIIEWQDENMPRNDRKIRSNDLIQTLKVASFRDVNVVSALYKQMAEDLYDDLVKSGFEKTVAEKKVGAQFNDKGQLTKLIKNKKGEYTGAIKTYLKLTEADAMAMGMPDTVRDLLFMSGKFNEEREAQWNYEIAYEKLVRSGTIKNKQGRFVKKGDPAYKKYKPAELADAQALYDSYDEGGPKYVFEVLKPQYFGYAKTKGVSHPVFLKHALQPKFYRHVEGTAFENIYLAAQENEVDIIGFESGQKVGNVTDEMGDFIPVYDSTGKTNTVFTGGKHSFPENMPLQTLYSRLYGIQVEQNNKPKKFVVRGTQVTKIVMTNLYENGLPINKEAEVLVKEYNQVLEKLTKLGKKTLLQELGLEYDANEGKYITKNLSNLIEILRNEAEARDLPDNIIEAINYIEDAAGKQSLLYDFDTIINREKIDNILNSIVNSRVISEKMHGKASVQVASTLYEKDPRNFVYLKDGVYERLTKEAIKDLTEEDKKSIVMTSSNLNFYKKNKKTGVVSRMEAYISWPFEGIKPEELGLKLINGIYEIPEGGIPGMDGDLLKILGFRIPTQSPNSIESIIIKGFTPAANGDMIVVPSEIVGKSGSDFDIDKLNLYLPNYYISGAERNYGSEQFKTQIYDALINQGINKAQAQQIINTYTKDDYIQINQSTFTEAGKKYHNASTSLKDIHLKLNAPVRTLSFIKTAIQVYNEQVKDGKQLKYVLDNDDTKKESLQNKLINIMSRMVLSPDNYAQLITPNSTANLKELANRIVRLEKIANPELENRNEKSLTYLRSFIGTVSTRERYITGKRMVGISALHTTFHTMAQVAGLKINSQYRTGRVKYLIAQELVKDPKTKRKQLQPVKTTEEISIRLPHHPQNADGTFNIGYKKDINGDYISDAFSESTSGFVDAAKDPFVFDLKLSMNTASTWFYLRHLGVSDNYISSFFSQPILADYFKLLGKNKSNFKKANETYLSREEMLYETIAPYYNKVIPGASLLARLDSIERMGDIGYILNEKNSIKKELNLIYDQFDMFDLDRLDEAIQQGSQEADARMQIAVLLNYLRYEAQAGSLSNFINAIGYDTAKTATLQENISQVSRWNKSEDEEFINNPEAILNSTFLGELKSQREDTFKMFREFFITLSPKVQEVFEPLYEKLDDPDVFLQRDDAYNLITKYQNHVLGYILHTTPFKNYDGREISLNEYYQELFKGDNSIAKRLLELKNSEDETVSENLFVKELTPILADDSIKTNNIKLFRNKLDTFEINSVVESLNELINYAEQTADDSLKKDINDVIIFSILQSGLQDNSFNYRKALNIENYSEILKNIFTNFKTDGALDTDQVWRTFHQNNWKNRSLIPKAPSWLKLQKDGTILVKDGSRYSESDYIIKYVMRPDVEGKDLKELKKEGRMFEAYAAVLYENSRTYNDGGKVIFFPINKLGDGIKMLEVYADPDTQSILEQNDHTKLTIENKKVKSSGAGWGKASDFLKASEDEKNVISVKEALEEEDSNIADVQIESNYYTPELLRANPNKIYVFGDNNQRQGKRGQASVRDEPNAMGISTKLRPSADKDAFMTDKDFDKNKAVIDSDISKIIATNKTVVFPKDGLGTGLAKLKEKAPKTYAYLKQALLQNFGFDNDTGEKVGIVFKITPAKITTSSVKKEKGEWTKMSDLGVKSLKDFKEYAKQQKKKDDNNNPLKCKE